jgi:hypothetical protein
MPVDSDLINLLDYDFDITEYGWENAGFSIAQVILGSDRDDDEFAEMLVEAFLAGAGGRYLHQGLERKRSPTIRAGAVNGLISFPTIGRDVF